MKNINEKYAHLQRTSWPQYANTTLGHLPADHYNQIEAAYEAQLATEAGHETPKASVPTPDIAMPVGDSMNSAVGTTSDSNGQAGEIVEAGGETPSEIGISGSDQVSNEPAQQVEAGNVETLPSVTIEGEKGQP